MPQFPRNNTFPEQLWNVSLLPMAAPRRAQDRPPSPGPFEGGSALRSAAVLSHVESAAAEPTARAA